MPRAQHTLPPFLITSNLCQSFVPFSRAGIFPVSPVCSKQKLDAASQTFSRRGILFRSRLKKKAALMKKPQSRVCAVLIFAQSRFAVLNLFLDLLHYITICRRETLPLPGGLGESVKFLFPYQRLKKKGGWCQVFKLAVSRAINTPIL